MKNSIISILLFVIVSCNQVKQKLTVSEMTDGMEVTKGYVVLSTDSIFHFDQKQYIVKTRGFFNVNGEVTRVVIWGVLGYQDWSKGDFSSITHFLEDNQIASTVNAYLLDNRHLVLNGDTVIVNRIDSSTIYYNLKSDHIIQGPKHLRSIKYR